MGLPLRIETAAVKEMAGRWKVLAGDLRGGAEPVEGLGLSCQASAAATNVGHADVIAGTAVLAARLRGGAARVDIADTRYATSDASSAARVSAVADPVTFV